MILLFFCIQNRIRKKLVKSISKRNVASGDTARLAVMPDECCCASNEMFQIGR